MAKLEKRIDDLQQTTLQQITRASKKAAVATKAATPKATTPKASSNVATTTKPEGWVVNIASLSNRKNANTLANKAKALGTDTRVESYPSQGRTLYRIRSYGYTTQSDAEKAAQRLQTALNISGMLVRKAE